MKRRSFLVDVGESVGGIGGLRAVGALGAVGGTSGLGGCVNLAGRGEGEIEERDLPERPAELTPESVADYVADYEEVRTHNRHVANGAVEVTVSTVATFDHASGDRHYATAQHAGTVYHRDGEDRSVGELYSDPTPYLVTPDRTLPIDMRRESVDVDEVDRPDDETTSPPLGVRLINAADESRELEVAVERRTTVDDDGDESTGGSENGRGDDADGAGTDVETDLESGSDDTVVRSTVGVESATAVELLGITDVRGGYRITARMEDNGVTGEGRIEVGLPSADRGPNVDVVVDDLGISTWHLPSFEAI